jgi:hypothetical protein
MNDSQRRRPYADEEEEYEERQYISSASSSSQQPVIVTAATPYSRTTWVVGGVLCILVTIAILFAASWIWSGSIQSHHNHFMSQIDERLSMKHHSDFNTNGLYSLSNAFKSTESSVLSLCHMALYSGGRDDSQLSRVTDSSVFVGEKSKNRTLLKERLYIIKSYFNIQYNANFHDDDVYRKLNIDPTERYQLIHYELASDFNEFSTIKLIESEFDSTKKAILIKKEFIVCSNNPEKDVKRCRVQMDGSLLMNNTRLIYLDDPSNHNNKDITVQNTEGPNQTQKPKDYAGIDITPEYKENLRGLKEEISHLRLYHLEFYRAEPQGHYHNSRDLDFFRESLLISIEPNKC